MRIAPTLLILMLGGPAAAFEHRESNGPATLDVRSDSDRSALALSGVLHVVVTVTGGKGLDAQAPVRPTADASWEVLATAATGPEPAGEGRLRWRQTLTLAPMTPGELKLELTPLVVRDDAAGEQRVTFKPFTVTVQSEIKDADVRHARDITSTEEVPPPPEGLPLVWLWLIVPAVLLPLAGLWLTRRRAAWRPASALRKALRECDHLAAMRLPEKNHARGFVALLTGIVRRYLERRFDVPARRQTTAELLRTIEGRTDLDDGAKRWLHAFLMETDLVKFAGGAAPADRCAALLNEVRQFCHTTSPRPGPQGVRADQPSGGDLSRQRN